MVGSEQTTTWTATQVADLVESRLKSVQTIDFLVELKREKAKDHDRYYDDSVIYQRNIAKFLDAPFTKRESIAASHTNPIAPLYFRCKAILGSESLRITQYSEPPSQGRNPVEMEECYSGSRWIRYYPTFRHGARVHLAESQSAPRLLAALGIQIPEITPLVSSRTFHEFILDSAKNNTIVSINELMEDAKSLVRVIVAVPKAGAPEGLQFYEKLTLDLDLHRALAPIRFVCELTTFDGHRYTTVEMPRQVVASWHEFQKSDGGVEIPAVLSIVEWNSLAHPIGPSGFVPVTKNGVPVVINGAPKPDLSKARVELYEIRKDTMSVTELRVNSVLPEPLCEMEYQAGTVVQDDTTREVFQMNAAGSPFNRAILEQISSTSSKSKVHQDGGFRIWFVLANAFVVLVVIAWLLYHWRRNGSP